MGALGGSSPPRRIPTTAVETIGGRFVDLPYPCPTDIDTVDLAHALARMGRFNNHTREHYSVAQHSVLMSYMPGNTINVARWCLFHDAHEAYFGDLSRPVYCALEFIHPMAGAAIKEIKRRLDRAIIERYGLVVGDAEKRLVKAIDSLMLVQEAERLMLSHGDGWDIGEPITLSTIRRVPWDGRCWSADTAYKSFLRRMEELELEL